ncbi:hypothetical protein EDB92DRAFT_1951136 [Lactarius akahatsu]|uniref:Uncharacterized protein n=1 Tax=Lactarius akahatsu TaxID=416441 RepID=A0AAD4LEC0_9AGAM|nr:hypothetical protein EDB92DRAFT_1951136 [Lactarius akahatsu]
MAQPPRNTTCSYSPSKLKNPLPEYIISTPSSGPLNMLETYALATTGPIIASGYGQPCLREDGQAYWDDTKSVIEIPSDPAAGRSLLDSQMQSPESEEPTVPAFPTHAAIKSGLLTELYDPKALDMTLITRGMDGEDDRLFDLALVETNSTLKDELACEVIEQVIGWGSYFITKLL